MERSLGTDLVEIGHPGLAVGGKQRPRHSKEGLGIIRDQAQGRGIFLAGALQVLLLHGEPRRSDVRLVEAGGHFLALRFHRLGRGEILLDHLCGIGPEDEGGLAEMDEIERGALLFRHGPGRGIEVGKHGLGLFLVAVGLEIGVEPEEGPEIRAKAVRRFLRLLEGLFVTSRGPRAPRMEHPPLPRRLSAALRVVADLDDDVVASLEEDLADFRQVVLVEVSLVIRLRPERGGKRQEGRGKEKTTERRHIMALLDRRFASA